MHSYIIIHNTHETFEVALFINNTIAHTISDDKRLASKTLIPHLDTILKKSNLSFTDISFIGVNQGPGLFSTLRSIITTVNALHFATRTPLIGVDALEATLYEFSDNTCSLSVLLLDAFNHEVYYAIAQNNHIIKKGYKDIDLFLQDLLTSYPLQKIRFIGKGTEIYKNLIHTLYKEHALIPDIIPTLCSLDAIAQIALESFNKQKKGNGYLFPLHLKKHPVELV
jgi:tRNA threonylcarbamoyladenosine biosynthesis protein TsaB